MESEVEEYSTPDFVESECSINIPGVQWNEETPRSFRVTPKPTALSADQLGVVGIPVSTIERKSDTPRPTIELSTYEEVAGNMSSKLSSVLEEKQKSMSSGDHSKENLMAKRVNKEVSGLCKRSPSVVSGSSREATPSATKISRILKESYALSSCASFHYSPASMPTSKSACSMTAKDGKEFELLQNGKNSGTLKNVEDQTDIMVVAERESQAGSGKVRKSIDSGRDSASSTKISASFKGKKDSSTPRKNSPSSIYAKNEENSCNSPKSSLSFERNSPIERPDTVNEAAVILKTLEPHEARSRSDCKTVPSDHGSSTAQARDLVLNCKSVTPISVKDEFAINDSKDGGSSSRDNKGSRSRTSSAHSRQNISRPGSLVAGELTTPHQTRRGTSAQRIGSNESLQSSNGGDGDPRIGKESHIPLPREVESPALYSFHSTPIARSTPCKTSNEEKISPRSTELIVKSNERKVAYSSELEGKSENIAKTSTLLDHDENMQATTTDAKSPSPVQCTETPRSHQSSSNILSGRVSQIPVRSCTPEVKEPAIDTHKKIAEKNSNDLCQDRTARVKRTVHHQENKTGKDAKKPPQKVAIVSKKEDNAKLNALERRKAYEAKRTVEIKAHLAKKSESIAKKQTGNELQQTPATERRKAYEAKRIEEIKAHLAKKSESVAKKQTGNELQQTPAIERRKAYEAKRTVEIKAHLAMKSESVAKKQTGNELQQTPAIERRKAYEAKRTVEIKAHLAMKSESIAKKQTGNELQQTPAIERRKAYEAKRTVERKAHLAKKSEKIAKKKIGNDMQQTPAINTEDHPTRKSEQITAVDSNATEEKAKTPALIEVDNSKYEDDFEPMDEEEKIVEHKNGVYAIKKTGIGIKGEATGLEIQKEFADKDANTPSLKEGQRKEEDENTFLLKLRVEKEMYDLQAPKTLEEYKALMGSTELLTVLPPVEGFDKQNVISNHSYYEPPDRISHVHAAQLPAEGNMDQIPAKRKKKKEKRKGKIRQDKSSDAAANSQDVKPKPPKAKKKVIVGYVPGYGSVRVMQSDLEHEIPKEKTQTRHVTSRYATEPRARPGRSQKEIMGYVPGYGPVRGAPVPNKPEVIADRVMFPPIRQGRVSSSLGDVSENKSCGKKKSVDVLECRARGKPFNTYVDEEASKRFERQYNRWYF
ncbi:uncharacterized protein LOC144626307 [Crassostrea virginica]